MDSSVAVVTYLLALVLAALSASVGLTVVAVICAVVGAMVMFRYELLWFHQRVRGKVDKVPAPEKV